MDGVDVAVARPTTKAALRLFLQPFEPQTSTMATPVDKVILQPRGVRKLAVLSLVGRDVPVGDLLSVRPPIRESPSLTRA
jgi:hypothetical protein